MKTLQGIKNENSLIIVNSSTGEAEGEIHPKDMANPPKLKAGFEYQTPGVYLASLNQPRKTQSEIEALLSQWYPKSSVMRLIVMDETSLQGKAAILRHSLTIWDAPERARALDGLEALIELRQSLPKKECKIDLRKKVLK